MRPDNQQDRFKRNSDEALSVDEDPDVDKYLDPSLIDENPTPQSRAYIDSIKDLL